jgi:two-component system, LytTR family, response regulator
MRRYLKRFIVRDGSRLYFIRVDDIDWIEAADNYVRLHCREASHVVRGTLATLESKLDPDLFMRIHRSVMVNVDRIKEMQPWNSGEYIVFLHDGTQLKLSRTFKDRLQHHFAGD